MKELLPLIEKLFSSSTTGFHKHFLPPDPTTVQERFRWMLAAGLVICPEYRFQDPTLLWWQDEKFTSYLKKFNELYERNSHRRWNLYQIIANLVFNVAGDTAECGAYRGAGSWIILDTLKGQGRMHYIFDSFEGLSTPLPVDGTHWKKGALSSDEATLHKNLSEFRGSYTTYKGWIPEHFENVSSKMFALVHIDVDLYEPTRDSLNFFYPRIVKGGVLVCDDYGFSNNPGANKAVDDFMKDKKENIFVPPCGGCYFVKQ